MAKSFKDYIGDFEAARDKLMFNIGELAQVPQRATNLLPRIEAFLNSPNPLLQQTGGSLKMRAEAVRNLARSEYTKATALMNEMLTLKNTIEKHPGYAQMLAMSKSELVVSLIGKFIKKSEDIAFFQKAALQAINLTGRTAGVIASLQKANLEIKAVENLTQQTADYAAGKGLLPPVSEPEKHSPIPKPLIAAGVGIVGLAAYLVWKGRK